MPENNPNNPQGQGGSGSQGAPALKVAPVPKVPAAQARADRDHKALNRAAELQVSRVVEPRVSKAAANKAAVSRAADSRVPRVLNRLSPATVRETTVRSNIYSNKKLPEDQFRLFLLPFHGVRSL